MLSAIGFSSSIKHVGADALARQRLKTAQLCGDLPGRGVWSCLILAGLDLPSASNLSWHLTSWWFLRLSEWPLAPTRTPVEGQMMNHKKTAVLLFAVVLAFLVGMAAAQTQTPAPGASSMLAGTPDSFLASCHSDLELTKKQVADIKATKSPRDAMTTLQAFDTAILIASDVAARS